MLVSIGAILGANLRYGVGVWVAKGSDGSFPWATLMVNLLGCFLVGVIAGLVPKQDETLRNLLIVGFLGGFTTFSAFGLETVRLFESGEWVRALGYVLTSTVGGIGLAWLGGMVVRSLTSR